MTPEEQRSTLAATLAISRKMHDNNPLLVFILISDGRNGRFNTLDIADKADRQQLLSNPSTNIRATITSTCVPDQLDDNVLAALQTQLQLAYTPNGKTYNAYDLGDFINRAKEAISAPA